MTKKQISSFACLPIALHPVLMGNKLNTHRTPEQLAQFPCFLLFPFKKGAHVCFWHCSDKWHVLNTFPSSKTVVGQPEHKFWRDYYIASTEQNKQNLGLCERLFVFVPRKRSASSCLTDGVNQSKPTLKEPRSSILRKPLDPVLLQNHFFSFFCAAPNLAADTGLIRGVKP